MMDDIPVDNADKENRRNIKVGCAVVAVAVLAIPTIIIAIPVIAGLYRWGFGG